MSPTLKEYAQTATYYEICVHVDGKFAMVVGKPIEWRLYIEQDDHVMVNDATFTGKLQADRVGENYATFKFGDAQVTLYNLGSSPIDVDKTPKSLASDELGQAAVARP
jgi:hypothetical protein